MSGRYGWEHSSVHTLHNTAMGHQMADSMTQCVSPPTDSFTCMSSQPPSPAPTTVPPTSPAAVLFVCNPGQCHGARSDHGTQRRGKQAGAGQLGDPGSGWVPFLVLSPVMPSAFGIQEWPPHPNNQCSLVQKRLFVNASYFSVIAGRYDTL